MSPNTGADDPRTDDGLVAAANAGEDGAIEALYVRYRHWVVAVARRATGSEDLALDVLQDVFLYFYKKFPGFELRAQLKTFLYPVVRHMARDRLSRRKRDVPLDAKTEANLVASSPPERPAGSDELSRAIEELTEHERELVALRYVDEMSLQEISESQGIPVGTAKSRLHRALARLAKILGKN